MNQCVDIMDVLLHTQQSHTHTLTETVMHFITTIYLCICLAFRIKKDGQERTEIEEDGVLKKILINGKTTHPERWDRETRV